MLTVSVAIIFCLNVISLILNGFGIYCLRLQKGGNENQRLLLQNLSFIEMVKIMNDYVSMGSYFTNRVWYDKYRVYLDILEVNILTVFFCSIVLLAVERLTCITLGLLYKAHVRKLFVKKILFAMWCLGAISGVLLFKFDKLPAKAYYYLSFDIFTVIIVIFTYAGILNIRRKTNGKISAERKYALREYKIVRVPVLIVTAFLLCNVIPDVIFTINERVEVYDVTVVLWGVGFLIDPCVYIFINPRTRMTALKVLCRLGCVGYYGRKFYNTFTFSRSGTTGEFGRLTFK